MAKIWKFGKFYPNQKHLIDITKLSHPAVRQLLRDGVRAPLLLAEVDEEEHGQVGAADKRGERHLE